MIECLRFSPWAQALTMAESVPVVHLSKSYSFATYIQADGIITFEVATNRTPINKARLYKMLLLDSSEGLVDPYSISSIDLIDMFYHMGYTGDISLLSKFRKPNLPPIWNGLFTLLFKRFSECVAGSDSISKLLYTIIYVLYHGINSDYGAIL